MRVFKYLNATDFPALVYRKKPFIVIKVVDYFHTGRDSNKHIGNGKQVDLLDVVEMKTMMDVFCDF